MDIVIVSYFHNAEGYVQRYFNQMAALQQCLELRGDTLRLILGYGDCTDNTEKMIREETNEDFMATLVNVSHGGKVFGSVVDRQRFKQLAEIGNKLWAKIPKLADVVGLIESDLTWKPEAILKLIDGVVSLEDSLSSPILLAPMVKLSDGRFYDTWAFRRDGRNFRNTPPFHPHLRQSADYVDMTSVGSCIFMRGEIARQLTWPERDVVVGLCAKATDLGVKVMLDTKTEVIHR